LKWGSLIVLPIAGLFVSIAACEKTDTTNTSGSSTTSYTAIQATFGSEINPMRWTNYTAQTHPALYY
jgi:hypothetical protein